MEWGAALAWALSGKASQAQTLTNDLEKPGDGSIVYGALLTPKGMIVVDAWVIRQGDTFTHVSAGGGGFGDAFERDPAAVLADVVDGKVSVDAARERYGVVVVDGEVDATATAEARRGRNAA